MLAIVFNPSKPIIMLILIFIALLIAAIIILTIWLIILSNFKNKQFVAIKNLRYMQSINLKERLQRINKIAKNNKQYNTILGIWISRCHYFLAQEMPSLLALHATLTNQNTPKKSYQLVNTFYHKSKALKHQMQLLVTEIDYFISIDQLLREYQLFFKQNFNYLQDEIVKVKLQNNVNEEQLNEVISVISDMFKTLETNICDANFSAIIKILSEVAIAIVTLTEILANLPTLLFIVNNEIKQKMAVLKQQCALTSIDKTLLLQYESLQLFVKTKLQLINNYINNLQYKKAQGQTQEVLTKIASFTNKIVKEQAFYNYFKQCYERYLVLDFNFNDIFAAIKKQFAYLQDESVTIINSNEINDLENIITKQLAIFAHCENLLIVEKAKPFQTDGYEVLLTVLKELFEHTIIVFNSLNEYNDLLVEQNKPKIKFELALNKINSMMLQIDNILHNINYYYLDENYQTKFNNLQKLITMATLNLKNNDYSSQLALDFNSLQNKIFHLYSEIKMAISIHKLAHATLIYANRYRNINSQLQIQFADIENSINNNNYQKALTLLLSLMS